MKTIEVYQEFLRDTWQFVQKIATPAAIGCLVVLGIGALFLASYFLSKVLEIYITSEKRFEVLSNSVFIAIFLGLFDVGVVYYYGHVFLISLCLFYLLVLLYFIAYYWLEKTLYRKLDVLLDFRNPQYLEYLKTLKVGDEVTVLYRKKPPFFVGELKNYYLKEAIVIEKKNFSFLLGGDAGSFSFDPYVDYRSEDEEYFIFPNTSYNLFLFELCKEKMNRMVREAKLR